MNNDENKTTNNIPLDLTGLPANLLYSPEELEKWLDDTSLPLSDDDIKSMSAYFQSEIDSVTKPQLFCYNLNRKQQNTNIYETDKKAKECH